MKVKEIGKYFMLAVISMAILYVWYPAVGVTDLGNWNHGLRNALAGVIFVFAAQLVTGRSLFHPSWRPGLVIFYLWLGAFFLHPGKIRWELGHPGRGTQQ